MDVISISEDINLNILKILFFIRLLTIISLSLFLSKGSPKISGYPLFFIYILKQQTGSPVFMDVLCFMQVRCEPEVTLTSKCYLGSIFSLEPFSISREKALWGFGDFCLCVVVGCFLALGRLGHGSCIFSAGAWVAFSSHERPDFRKAPLSNPSLPPGFIPLGIC